MRKVIRFLPEVPSSHRWPGGPGRSGAPTRATLATALSLDGLPAPRFAAVEVLWYDGEHDDTPASDGERRTGTEVEAEVDEVVVRGAETLAARWVAGGERFKMMSFGRRNPALTRAGFVARWQAEAGRLGGDRIPDELRGVAYVQDRPLGDDPPLDAINEVWFDGLDGLRRRAEWFAARPVPPDLMSPPDCWSLHLRETVLRP